MKAAGPIGYVATHVGEGRFMVRLSNGETKIAGSSLRGMIRFTYFEDYTLPEIGWKVSREQLVKDHLAKITAKIANGEIK